MAYEPQHRWPAVPLGPAMARNSMDLFVLDTLADDIEALEDILRSINHPDIGWQTQHGGPIGRPDVHQALLRLVQEGFVEVSVFDPGTKALVAVGENRWPTNADLSDLWFRITERGRLLHSNWELH